MKEPAAVFWVVRPCTGALDVITLKARIVMLILMFDNGNRVFIQKRCEIIPGSHG